MVERADLRQMLEGLVSQFLVPTTESAPTGPAPAGPELRGLEGDSPTMVWLREYLDETSRKFPFGMNARPATLASVGKLPLPGVSDFELAMTSTRAILGMLTRWDENQFQTMWGLRALIVYLLPRVKPTGPAEPLELLRLLRTHTGAWSMYGISGYVATPQILRSAVRMIKSVGWTPELRAVAEAVRNQGSGADDAERRKAVAALAELLETSTPEERVIDATDDWGVPAQAALQALPAELRGRWIRLLLHTVAVTGSRPSATWLREMRVRVDALGADEARSLVERWLGLLAERGAGSQAPPAGPFGEVRPGSMIPDRNADLLRGLLWTSILFDDEAMARTVGQATKECFRKIPDFGARSTKAGNAGIYALSQLEHREAVAQLHQLQQSLKLPSVQKTIDGALQVASERAGLSRADLEELSTPTFGLENGRREWQVGDYRAEMIVEGANVVTRWYGPVGKLLRNEPAAARRQDGAQVKEVRQTAATLAAALRAQQDRIEGLYLLERSWSYATWRERYLDHPLRQSLARRLIWELRAPGQIMVAAWADGRLVDVADQPISDLPADSEVRLWHPAGAPADEVLAWRRWLARHEVSQPFKQAHREIYLLTDAERVTETYSNRFAAHVLRQHQFSALCQQRGWHYRLQGAFDGWNAPTLPLPAHGLEAEFIVDGGDATDEALSGMGIYLYVATDQVRFQHAGTQVHVLLSDVPPLAFSEVMRDVDLFVGVCSVGNDPTWADNGPDALRDYWTSYAVGELSTSAQTRREVLAELLPRLKIADHCTLEDRFLVVRGDLRTYRIHLGSGNILMEPNNQYLCIVPARGGGIGTSGSQVFLPFEGDGLLAIILSKAFLLADDRSITDLSITRQLDPSRHSD